MNLVIALLEVDIRVGVTAIWFSVPGAMWNLKERKTIGHNKFLLHTPMWDLKKKLGRHNLQLSHWSTVQT